MSMQVFYIAGIAVYLLVNILEAAEYSVAGMKRRLFNEHMCFVSKFLTTVFYAPAWVLKGLKIAVDRVVR